MFTHLAFTQAIRDCVARRHLTASEQQAQYDARTTKRPLLCFAVIAASPLVVELLCRLLGAQ